MSRPCGVVVSAQASASERNPAPAFPIASSVLSKSRVRGRLFEADSDCGQHHSSLDRRTPDEAYFTPSPLAAAA